MHAQLTEARQAAADAAAAARAAAAALPAAEAPVPAGVPPGAPGQPDDGASAMELATLRSALATTQAQLKVARKRAQDMETELAAAYDMRAELDAMQTRLDSRSGRGTPSVVDRRTAPPAGSGRVTPSW